jgi:hypothetical protein
MAIATAIDKSGTVYVYNEKNQQMFSRMGKLHGFTSSTVSIVQSGTVYIFNEKNQQVGSRPLN